jgi:DNA (cytosine-5)-methyltransferase 1
MRIIKELRKETNNAYPRISIWENVAGALSSNRGADFGIILDEMAQAGAMVIEWAMLDAQHFGIPQRRRRVFVIAIFDPAIATNCPNPLLPVSQSLRGNTQKGKPKGQAVASETSAGFGSGSFGGWTETDTAITLSARDHKSSNTIVGSLTARDYKGVGSQYVDEGKVIVEPFVKSRRAQTSDDDETWVKGEINPTLNSFDTGDTRSTTAIVEPMLVDGRRVDDVRVYEPPVQTLQARMGTGGNNVPLIGQETLAFDTKFGSNADICRDQSPPLKASQGAPSVSEPTMAVRRLTPLECERLMGWPDDHTRYKADGTEQADTHRYKQCGNGVASPVAKWIAQHILNIPK